MLAAAVHIALSGCAASVGTNFPYSVATSSASVCVNQCAELGLPLDSVVIIANMVGCVCRGDSGGGARAGAAGAAGGATAAVLARQHEEAQQQQKK